MGTVDQKTPSGVFESGDTSLYRPPQPPDLGDGWGGVLDGPDSPQSPVLLFHYSSRGSEVSCRVYRLGGKARGGG